MQATETNGFRADFRAVETAQPNKNRLRGPLIKSKMHIDGLNSLVSSPDSENAYSGDNTSKFFGYLQTISRGFRLTHKGIKNDTKR